MSTNYSDRRPDEFDLDIRFIQELPEEEVEPGARTKKTCKETCKTCNTCQETCRTCETCKGGATCRGSATCRGPRCV